MVLLFFPKTSTWEVVLADPPSHLNNSVIQSFIDSSEIKLSSVCWVAWGQVPELIFNSAKVSKHLLRYILEKQRPKAIFILKACTVQWKKKIRVRGSQLKDLHIMSIPHRSSKHFNLMCVCVCKFDICINFSLWYQTEIGFLKFRKLIRLKPRETFWQLSFEMV